MVSKREVAWRACAFGKPPAQGGGGAGGQRGDPVFAALAVAGGVGAGAEVDVAAGQGGEFGGPQPGLDGEGDPGVVTPPGAGGPVGGGQQRLGFGVGEEGDDRLVGPLGRDGQDAFDVGGVLGVAQRRVGEQGVDRGQPGVACGDAVAALVLDVVEERGDHRGVQVGDVKPAGQGPGGGGGEAEQQPQRVPVSGDGVRAGPPLGGQPLGEERLDGGGDRGHRGSPGLLSPRRRAASASSSGAACRYQ